MIERQAGVSVIPVTTPTRTVRPVDAANQPWRIVSHLMLNHVSLLDAEALKSLLYLYQLICHDDPREDVARRMIQSLTRLSVEPSTERVVIGGRPAFVRGQHVQLEFDSSGLPHGRSYLMASVLARFLSRYGTVNSFVRASAMIDGKEVDLSWSQIGTRPVT
jgi:type VI secretion system protein ImpG